MKKKLFVWIHSLLLVTCILLLNFSVFAEKNNSGDAGYEYNNGTPVQENVVDADIIVYEMRFENGSITNSGFYGDEIHVHGGEASTNSQVNLYWESVRAWDGRRGLLNSTISNSTGHFEVWFNVPQSFYGIHDLCVEEVNTSTYRWLTFYVNVTNPTALGIGVEAEGEISTPGEFDGYSISVSTGLYQIETRGESLDTYMYLIDKSGESTLRENDDAGEWLNSRIVWLFIEPGTYYVNIRGFSPSYMGNYTIIIEEVEFLISHFEVAFSENMVRMIYPSDTTPKPLNCSAASVSDWLASSFIYSYVGAWSCAEGQDTESAFVNQLTGAPTGGAGNGVITFGGPFVNPVVKRAESDLTSPDDRAPIKFHSEGDTFYFQLANGTGIPNASLPLSVINHDEDLFVIETFLDSNWRFNMFCYGFGWKGTYAAGKYFETDMKFWTYNYPHSWIIVKWEDTNGNGFVNSRYDGDTYTMIAHS